VHEFVLEERHEHEKRNLSFASAVDVVRTILSVANIRKKQVNGVTVVWLMLATAVAGWLRDSE